MKQLHSAIIIILCIIFMTTGCKFNITENPAVLTIIEIAGYDLGYYVGKSKTDLDDIAIADAYNLARTGKLTNEQITEAFSKLKIENSVLAGNLRIALKSMGASFDAGGNLMDISGIPVAYWDKAAEGYVIGFEFGKANQKGINVSAVLKYMPK